MGLMSAVDLWLWCLAVPAFLVSRGDCFSAPRLAHLARRHHRGLTPGGLGPQRRTLPRAALEDAVKAGASHGGEPVSVKIPFGGDGKEITIETGVIGKQASGAVVVSAGGTMVYTTACAASTPGDFDFCPLRVDYQERRSGAGSTKGGYVKRDGRASDEEILISRIIDRPIRPMIADGWTHDTQLLSWVLSYDSSYPPESLAVVACSAALALSNIPMKKVVAAVSVGLSPHGDFVINPSKAEMKESLLNMTVAGTKDAVLMVEGEALFVPEETLLTAISKAQGAIADICRGIEDLAAQCGKEKTMSTLRHLPDDLTGKMSEELGAGARRVLKLTDPVDGEGMDTLQARGEMESLTSKALELFQEEFGETNVKVALKKLLVKSMREIILETGRRADGRGVEEVRPVDITCGILPGTHGSALFTRGATQAVATATLGDSSMQQRFEGLDGESSKRFYLQYSFPPSSVGEVGRVGAPGRREVGHGHLAERSLSKTIPVMEDFPYSIRVESLITESSGSSSMASVCGGSLAMLDAGVPLSTVVAGVAMGLIFDEESSTEEPVILTDILGLEDALGTMDFKVAGDATGITAMQLDIKCEGLSIELLERALAQARRGRLHILEKMTSAMPSHRSELPSTVPKILQTLIPPSNIGKLIGSGGKTIRALVDELGLEALDVNDVGEVSISGFDSAVLEKAKAHIDAAFGPNSGGPSGGEPAYSGPMPEVGTVFKGCEVTSVKNFGAFVALGDEFPGLEGLVHISELHTDRVRNIEAFVQPGHVMDVKVLGINDKKVKLSRKALLVKE